MRHHLLSSSITMASSSSSSSSSSSLSLSKPTTTHHHHHKKPSHLSNPNPSSTTTTTTHCSSILCKHSPSATLDILILILVLFSGTFLITSYFSYIFHSLSLLLPPLSHSLLHDSSLLYFFSFLLFFLFSIFSFEICCGNRSRKCHNPSCKGLKKAMEFDLQLQTEDCLRSASAAVREFDELPWKGGTEGNPDYECLRAELRKMAPPNGRAVLLFRAKCGCPVAKLQGWGAKRGRRHKNFGLFRDASNS
ncbi:uncharacterized protein At5g19025-like isoform X2 [Camellia sinensis]|uniref:uncharacterized protein At5g19025-like isoform X2 n=1 Tax=Camellia sinensis TaxID=4442 RepID=UPI0010364F86|nr:uncharacterized protein At5g19025-like isoform X2 [Camellia sinensis]XP_028058812.1 uncharacterized protein At5g19025-like isoform X2 [Camellia sinensis]